MILKAGLAMLFALGARGQTFTNLTSSVNFTAGKLAIYRAGDGTTNFNIANIRQHPAFIDEYDPALLNQAAPLLSAALPTNDPVNTMFVNAHAGSEGQGMTRSADRRYLAMTGYTSPIDESLGTPSGSNSLNRGFGIMDASGNFAVIYGSQFWYGIQPGITQNNPRGIATDGTNNFWGAGTIAGAQTGGFQESGTLFWNGQVSGDPELVQSIVNSSYYTKVINNVLYMVAKNETGGASANGIYNFVDVPDNGGGLVPLPWIPGGVQHIVTTNLFLNFGSSYKNVLTFDMNRAGTIVYAADNTAGIVKFTNNGSGTWTSPYVFGATNLGTLTQTTKAQGCFGIAVDFSGANPVIYATTMEQGDGNNTCSNRLIRIVDNGNPGTNVVAETLAAANGINEVFRGIDFTPDLKPLITSAPAGVSTTNGGSATFEVAASSFTNLFYQWQQNGSTLPNQTNASLSFNNLTTNYDGYTYQCIVSNVYGAVTSAPPALLTVTFVTIPPSLSNGVAQVTNFVGDNALLSVNPNGTPPFTYQWYFGTTALVDDGVTFSGSTSSMLTITNVQLTNAGNYSVTISNAASGISNLVYVLSVQYVLPSIGTQPASLTMLQGQTNKLKIPAPSITGTVPLDFQWYQGDTAPLTLLLDGNPPEFTGTTTNSLVISGVTLADATNYFCVITNGGGGTTSQLASVTVIVPVPYSYVGYGSNQVYSQNFDSLPYTPGANINTVSGGGPTTIGGVTYDVANPFDFAYPLYTNISGGNSGGLTLSNAMPGWYGSCDVPGGQLGGQLGSADGSTTTGGIYSFGKTNSANRCLGLISTSSSGFTHFGLKLINQTGGNLDYVSLQYVGEYWKSGTKPKTLEFGYAIDPAGTNSVFSFDEIAAAVSNAIPSLKFNFPTGAVGGKDGTLTANQTNLSAMYMPLTNSWTPGSALWLVWSINDATGSGQGYGIDNFRFYASATNLPQAAVTTPGLGGLTFSGVSGAQFKFNNAPGASAYLTVWGTTDLTQPFGLWQNLGHPTEVSFGSYQFLDPSATGASQKFYRVTSP